MHGCKVTSELYHRCYTKILDFWHCKTAIWLNLKLAYESITPHYCILLYSVVLCLQPQKSSMHAYTYKYNCVSMCVHLCVCACACVWMRACVHGFVCVCACACVHGFVCVLDVHACVCMCICMYVCDSYNTQIGMEPIGGSLYFNFLSNSCLFVILTVLLMATPW